MDGGPARIISLSKNSGERDLTLGQDGECLVLRFRTGTNDANGTRHEARLCRLVAGATIHVLLTHRPGETACYRNGEKVFRGDQFGDLQSWATMPLNFGDETDGGRDWKGTLESVAFLQSLFRPGDAPEFSVKGG